MLMDRKSYPEGFEFVEEKRGEGGRASLKSKRRCSFFLALYFNDVVLVVTGRRRKLNKLIIARIIYLYEEN